MLLSDPFSIDRFQVLSKVQVSRSIDNLSNLHSSLGLAMRIICEVLYLSLPHGCLYSVMHSLQLAYCSYATMRVCALMGLGYQSVCVCECMRREAMWFPYMGPQLAISCCLYP